MCYIISFANQKGGVAKTTSTLNIAYQLMGLGRTCLMIDLDPQASLTISAGLDPLQLDKTIAEVLDGEATADEAIIFVAAGVAILPSSINLAGTEARLFSEFRRESKLARAIRKVANDYDYVLIDCPPQLATLTVNALFASDAVIIPVETDYLAYMALGQLMTTLKTVQEDHDISVLGVIATKYNSRAKDDNEILEALQNEQNVIGVIKDSTSAKKGIYNGRPVSFVKPRDSISIEYRNIANKIIKMTSK